MRQKCKSCTKRDIGKVIPGLFPDIEDMITNHRISDTTAQCVYNELTDIKDVGFKVNDDFDAVMLSRSLHASISANRGTGSSQQAGSSAPVASAE